jgi:hypothetical protein
MHGGVLVVSSVSAEVKDGIAGDMPMLGVVHVSADESPGEDDDVFSVSGCMISSDDVAADGVSVSGGMISSEGLHENDTVCSNKFLSGGMISFEG